MHPLTMPIYPDTMLMLWDALLMYPFTMPMHRDTLKTLRFYVSKSVLIFQAMLRNLNRWCVVVQCNAPTIQSALAYGVTHPTSTLYFFIYIEFFSPTYLKLY